MNVQVGNGSFAFSDYPARMVMYDHDGIPVWYYIHGPDNDRGGALSTEFLDSDTILVGPTGVAPDDVPPPAKWTCPAILYGKVPRIYPKKSSSATM